MRNTTLTGCSSSAQTLSSLSPPAMKQRSRYVEEACRFTVGEDAAVDSARTWREKVQWKVE